MSINTATRKQITYFVGEEVEHTIAHGARTLFVIGAPDIDEVLELAKKNDVRQIYFGASQSFNPQSSAEWIQWTNLLSACLLADGDYWVTLDFDVMYAQGVLESLLNRNNRFIPMISVKIPHIEAFNYNTTLKIDDTTWGATNSGVWTHKLHDLMANEKYTHWGQYVSDYVIK